MTLLAGRYELGEELGSGGMGRVVAGHDRVLGRDVAVKLLSPQAERTARERFVREARSAARIHHPNAVAVYDTGEDDGQPYLVMELVRGRTLADVLEEDGPLEVEEAIGITVGVLDALSAAHRAGMVHRDVKPGNVLLPEDGGVKLSDFGIAKALDDAAAELTATGSLMGTPTYLAPELVGGSAPSPASDVYSVGCLLYAQLTGRPPFARGEPIVIAYAHRNEPVPPILDARPDLPPELVTVVERALEKEPAERYDGAAAMRTALLDGPEAVSVAPGAAGVAAAAGGARAPQERTQLLHDDEPTRVVGAPAAADAAPAGGATPRRGRRGGARWWVPLLVVLALAGLALALWPLLATDDPTVDEDEPVENEVVEDEPVEEEEPDPGPPDDTPADEAPGQDDPADEPGPPEDTPGDDPPAEEEPEDDGDLLDDLLDGEDGNASGEEEPEEDGTET